MGASPRRHLIAIVAVAAVVTACAAPAPGGASGPSGGAPTPGPSDAPCGGGWGCDQEERFAAAESYLDGRPGRLGILVHDRVSGRSWRAGDVGARYWAGSVPKLAMALALREEARAGRIELDAADHRRIAAMLSISDNGAADALWDAHGDSATWRQRWRRYGMASTGYVDGFPSRWGFVKGPPGDLAALMAYVLDRAHPDDRRYIVDAMRAVGPVQRWGVWGAGPDRRPGVKNGWSVEKEGGRDIWITATVGFAGPDERYVVAAMYHQPPRTGSIGQGVHVLTDLVATVFGAPVPAPAVVPTDY